MKSRYLYHNEEIVALAKFSESFEINVVYYSKACAFKFFFFGWLLYHHVCNIFAVFVCK